MDMPLPSPIGLSLRRTEDRRFLTGQGRYVADIHLPGECWLHVHRSPHAHARILSIDAAAARAAPGVLAVLTASDLPGLGPIPCSAAIPPALLPDGPVRVPPRLPLPPDRVRHVGEPVCAVVAETARAAQDAAELLDVTYDPLPCVTEAADALRPGAPLLWEEVPGNQAFRFRKGDAEAVEAALARAAHRVTLTLTNNRLIIAPLEHRGAVAAHGPDGYALELSGQGVHGLRADLATMLGIPPDRLHVRTPDVGGGFGVKNGVYPEYALLLHAARLLARPVRWEGGHADDFVSTAHGRDNLSTATLALDATGRFLALKVQTVANLGAAMSTGGPGSSTTAPGNAMGAGYAIPAVHMDVRGAYTNTVPLDAYRGAGKPEANYLIERLVDEAARLLDLDRVELRRRNLVRTFPHPTAMDTAIEPGAFAANIDRALQAADAAGFPARRAAGPLPRGLGVTCFMETARGAPGEGAEVRFLPGGRVALHLGTQSNGQGHETTFPQVAAARLGLPVDRFDFVQADTRRVRAGHGHGGARSLHMGGAALSGALDQVLAKGRARAAELLQADPAAVHFADARFHAGTASVSLADAAAGGALDSYHWTPLDRITFPNGVHVAEVEVDPDTGTVRLLRYTGVDDYGTAINPLLLVGQVQGGLAQGIGQALMERVVHDPDTGQLLSGSFADYQLPRAADLPDLTVLLHGIPSAANPLGVKGAGQAGAIAAPQAVVSAVLDALAPLGVTHLDMPLTPERVWTAIRAARAHPAPSASKGWNGPAATTAS